MGVVGESIKFAAQLKVMNSVAARSGHMTMTHVLLGKSGQFDFPVHAE